jgi:hypothetical protein
MGTMKSMAYTERGGAALRYPAAALAFVSEVIRLRILPGQLVVAMLPGIFFLLVAIGQGLLAVSLLFHARGEHPRTVHAHPDAGGGVGSRGHGGGGGRARGLVGEAEEVSAAHEAQAPQERLEGQPKVGYELDRVR